MSSDCVASHPIAPMPARRPHGSAWLAQPKVQDACCAGVLTSGCRSKGGVSLRRPPQRWVEWDFWPCLATGFAPPSRLIPRPSPLPYSVAAARSL
eukprot:9479836-Pyramimonas_sp.AAC.1